MKEKLESNEECRFCKIFEQKGEFEEIDRPIAKSKNFMALISKGAIVEGWVLVIPENHAYSMRKFYCDNEFTQFTNSVLEKIKQTYNKNCMVFEHGANSCGSLTSCGTNHAHLHVIPYDKSLLNEIKKNGLEWQQCRLSEIESLAGKYEYWFYAEKVENIRNLEGYLHIIKQPESQYFRKIIAEKEGCAERFSYKEFRFEKNEKSTYKMLKE